MTPDKDAPLSAPAIVSADTATLAERFTREVLEGLSSPRKHIPCTWLYDSQGSALFEAITALPEYYPTRTEIEILTTTSCLAEVAARAGSAAVVVEPGSGAGHKTRLLLDALQEPAAYVPIDVSPGPLQASAAALKARFPALRCVPIVADFSTLAALPAGLDGRGTRLGFFPGSTLGNFKPPEATGLLQHLGHLLGPGAVLLVGIDITRDPAVLVPAYDDAQGVTAAFNLNLLTRINRELGADFDLANFRHEARFATPPTRIEMHLVSRVRQRVTVSGHGFNFEAGESIHTENSHKYSDDHFKALAYSSGWVPLQRWTDPAQRFSVHLLQR